MTFEAKRLGDVAEIIGGGTPSTKDAGNWDGDIPWLTPKDLSTFEGIYIDRGSRSITEQGFKTSSAKMLPTGAVLYTSRAPIGYVAIASNPISTNQGFKSLILKDGYVPEFVFYLLKASKSEIEAHASGGTFAEISAKALSDVVLRFPPQVQQQAISKLLKSLDEKIAANNAISKTLEDIAQTIYKSWFIDFDPVKAKMAGGKPAGMDAATAALFPDSMVESEAGLIPRGWEVSALISLVDSISDGDWIESKDQSSEGYRLLQIGNIGLGEFVESGKERYVSQETFKRLRCTEIMPGDVLVARMPEPTGRSWFVDSLVQPAITSVDVAIIRAHPSRHSNRYVSMFLNLPSTLKLMESLQTGSTRQRIKRTYIETLRIITPDAHVLAEFDGITEKLFGLSDSLRKESRVLKGIRDSLLPRLISGELQIPEEMLAS